RKLEKGISSNDVPQIFVAAYTYELPFGKGKKMLSTGVGAMIADGWQFSGIQQYSVGKPLVMTMNNTLPIFNGVLRPNLNTGVPLTQDHVNPLGDSWLNKAAFGAPAAN